MTISGRKFVKVLHVETMEIRLVRLTPMVERMLVKGQVHWARRRRGELMQTADLLLVEADTIWEKLVPYFEFEEEKNRRKHVAQWKNAGKAE